MRQGDPRAALADIPADSVALILTAPPIEHLAWLASWAAHVLLPGGALVCVVDPPRVLDAWAALDRALR